MKSKKQLIEIFISLLMMVALILPVSASGGGNESNIIRLNPELKVNRNSNGSVTVTSKNPRENIRHEFYDFYADLIMAAYHKRPIDSITETLRKKYYFTEDECRREIKHALNTLAEWKIILKEDNLALH